MNAWRPVSGLAQVLDLQGVRALLILAPLMGAGGSAGAAERTWDGGALVGNGWADAGNWVGAGIPAAGDDLRFPAGAARLSNQSDFTAGTVFITLTYAGAGYMVSGNEIGLTGGIVVSHGAGSTVLNLPVTVGASQAFTVSLAGANLYLNGDMTLEGFRPILTFDGAGQTVVAGDIGDGRTLTGGTLRKSGAGTLWIFQHPTFGGSTLVNGGTLRVDGRMSNSVVTVNAGGTLRGGGKVGGVTANSSGTVAPGMNSPDVFESLGNVVFNAGSVFSVRLDGPNAGVTHDQLKVRGSVTLGGILNVTTSAFRPVGERVTIIDNDGADDVTGTFAGLPEGAVLQVNGRPFKISYGDRFGGPFGRDANDVTLEAVPALVVWAGGDAQNRFWSVPQNWAGDALPMPGDDLEFPGSAVTQNDFPAGRAFGSILFGPGIHGLNGNLATVRGHIGITAANQVDIFMPLAIEGGIRLAQPGTLVLKGAVALTADQVFWAMHSNANLRIEGTVDAGSHDLILRNQPGWVLGNVVPTVKIAGRIQGTGRVIKEGAGALLLDRGTLAGPGLVVINDGEFRVEGQFHETNVLSSIIVNTGAVLSLGGASKVRDVEVRGGVFAPSRGASVERMRLLDGAVYRLGIYADTFGVVSSSTLVNEDLVLSNCVLNVSVSPNTVIGQGEEILVTSRQSSPSSIGTFNGLPEDSRFIADGHVFNITYRGGLLSNSVSLIANTPFVWNGGGSGNTWSTEGNWSPDLAPIPGAALVFPDNVAKVAMINVFDPGTSFRSLTFAAPSYLLVGNQARITEGIYHDAASGETMLATDLTASDDVACRVAGTGRLQLEGVVGGSGSWKKLGPGTLRFAGNTANTLAEMIVLDGELELDKPSGVNALPSLLQIGDGTNEACATLLASQQIDDSAEVVVRAGARFDLNGFDETIGLLRGGGAVSLDGRFVPGRFAQLTVSTGVFTGVITGNGGLTKTGPGASTLVLTGINPFTGQTIVNGGRLTVEGVQTNSPIRLNGGVLTGRGQVGTLTANLGGEVRPGIAASTFQNALWSRDAAFNSTTTFGVLLTSTTPGFENSHLRVAGTVNLGGCRLSVTTAGSFTPTNGAIFIIIDNDGTDPVAGTFAVLPEGAVFGGDGIPFRISYAGGTGNDVVLTRVAAPPSTLKFITALSNGQMRIEGLGIGGVIYPIQAASNLNPVIQWTPVGSGTGDAAGVFRFIDVGTSNRPMHFYRAVSP